MVRFSSKDKMDDLVILIDVKSIEISVRTGCISLWFASSLGIPMSSRLSFLSFKIPPPPPLSLSLSCLPPSTPFYFSPPFLSTSTYLYLFLSPPPPLSLSLSSSLPLPLSLFLFLVFSFLPCHIVWTKVFSWSAYTIRSTRPPPPLFPILINY